MQEDSEAAGQNHRRLHLKQASWENIFSPESYLCHKTLLNGVRNVTPSPFVFYATALRIGLGCPMFLLINCFFPVNRIVSVCFSTRKAS